MSPKEIEDDKALCAAAASDFHKMGAAAKRLPAYIAEAEETERRLAKVERFIEEATPHAPTAWAYLDGLRFARDLMRGAL